MSAKKDLAKFKEFYSFALSENPEMVVRFEAYYEARLASEEMALAERVIEDFIQVIWNKLNFNLAYAVVSAAITTLVFAFGSTKFFSYS